MADELADGSDRIDRVFMSVAETQGSSGFPLLTRRIYQGIVGALASNRSPIELKYSPVRLNATGR